MATQYQNLSDYDPDLLPSKDILEQQRYAIAVADWNPRITEALLQGAIEGLTSHGVLKRNIEVVHVPGTFELTSLPKIYVRKHRRAKVRCYYRAWLRYTRRNPPFYIRVSGHHTRNYCFKFDPKWMSGYLRHSDYKQHAAGIGKSRWYPWKQRR